MGPLRAVALVGAAWVLLLGAVAVALRVPAEESVPGVGDAGALDYSSAPRSLAPLSEQFIERVLGRRVGGGVGSATEQGPQARATRSIGGPTDRKVVEHALTNDEAADAVRIASLPFTARSDTAAASRSNDPTDCEAEGGTVWYRYVPPRDLGLVAYTFGSDHAVALGVFERTTGGWSSLGCERNEGGDALLPFAATKGTAYYFQVTAPTGGGKLRFNLDPHGTLTILTRDAAGAPANRHAWTAPSSYDWRYFAFTSDATNLVPQPPCSGEPPYTLNEGWVLPDPFKLNCFQVYVLDRRTGRYSIASSAPDGTPGNHDSAIHSAMSGDGRFVAFSSNASNLVPNDLPGQDLFVKDLLTGAVEVIATNGTENLVEHLEHNAGAPTVGFMSPNWRPVLSRDGRIVVFQTRLPFDRRDRNENWDVYAFDRLTRRYELVSVPHGGVLREPSVSRDAWASTTESHGAVDLSPSMSPDGRFVVFRTPATDLVPNDTNHTWDTFVRDRRTGVTDRVSVSTSGEEGNGPSGGQQYLLPQISADGRFVVFDTLASNLVPDDTPLTLDVLLRDRLKRTTTTFAISRDRDPSSDMVPRYASISRNGRFIGYTNWGRSQRFDECEGAGTAIDVDEGGSGIVIGDMWECNAHVYVYDRLTDTTFPVTVLPSGKEWWGAGGLVSEDGARVAFLSYAQNKANERVAAFQIYLYEAPRAR